MTNTRLDVPALLREAADAHSEDSNRHHYYAQQLSGEAVQSHLLRGHDSDDAARFFIRLADAVEAYRVACDRRPKSPTGATEAVVEMHRRADAVLALLRGEVEP